MKVIVCGDRHWKDYRKIRARLSKLPKSAIVIHGGATGADAYAESEAEFLGMLRIRVRAHWVHSKSCGSKCDEVIGKRAGPIRNHKMLDLEPDLVLAFHSDLESSKGTRHMVTIARKAGVQVEVIT